MPSNNFSSQQQVVQNPTIPGFTIGGGGGGGSSEARGFSGIEDPQALQLLMSFLQQQVTGGTAEEKALRKERMAQIGSARGTLADYTKGSAFSDAAALMAQNLRQSMEKNMPVINKAIQGAGTSASSMQALLSQKLATESAQAAGALGAQQAASYGGISAQLQSVLEALTRSDPNNSAAIVNALGLFKNQRSSSTQVQNPTNPTVSVTASGGGSSVASPQAKSGIESGVWYGPGMIPRDQAWIDATSGLPRASGGFDNGYAPQYGGSAPLTAEELMSINDDGQSWGFGD